MSDKRKKPVVFEKMIEQNSICLENLVSTQDGFYAVFKSISDILADHSILEVPGSDGGMLACDKFFDDWYLYAVPYEDEYVYSLFKLREQEHDAKNGIVADGDAPGSTVSFIEFQMKVLLDCLENPVQDNRAALNKEINRVVAYGGQRHHKALKDYFKNSVSEGAYVIATLYIRHIASFAECGWVEVPDYYRQIVEKGISGFDSAALARLPQFIDRLNDKAGMTICDHEKIYIKDRENLSPYECIAILATHTGNTSLHSFAAEVEFHAKFLIPAAKIRIPFLGKSIYASAIRADMTIDDNEFEGPAPYYNPESKLMKRHRELHKEYDLFD